jgi:hypothetical protein
MNSYQQRVNAERLARQAEPVKKLVKEILKELESIERCVYWAIDPEDALSDTWPSTIIERAHALVDMGHDYRAALKADPPPKEEENEPLSA